MHLPWKYSITTMNSVSWGAYYINAWSRDHWRWHVCQKIRIELFKIKQLNPCF